MILIRCFTPSVTAFGGDSSLKEGALENGKVFRQAEAGVEPLPYMMWPGWAFYIFCPLPKQQRTGPPPHPPPAGAPSPLRVEGLPCGGTVGFSVGADIVRPQFIGANPIKAGGHRPPLRITGIGRGRTPALHDVAGLGLLRFLPLAETAADRAAPSSAPCGGTFPPEGGRLALRGTEGFLQVNRPPSREAVPLLIAPMGSRI